jgi:hypothetical protein
LLLSVRPDSFDIALRTRHRQAFNLELQRFPVH